MMSTNNHSNDQTCYSEIEQRIITIIEGLRSSIQSHSGDISFCRYDQGIVYVVLHGACVGCPISQITIKMGIEEALKAEIPEIISVIAKNDCEEK